MHNTLVPADALDQTSRMTTPSVSSGIFGGLAYGWVIVVLAALAMIGTLPGRTHGLGMITERLLSDTTLNLDRTSFSMINLWATLIGAAFCIPAGWMLDRFGIRVVSTAVIALLGIVILTMTLTVNPFHFAILITLTRGFGQSALSVVSISMIGKWFRAKQLPFATAVYSVCVSMGFAAAFIWGRSQRDLDWRTPWQSLGFVLLLVFVPLFAILVRSAPKDTSNEPVDETSKSDFDFTVDEAISTPAFWVLGIATSFYGLVSSGVSLFNESLLFEQGFPRTTFYELGTMTTVIGLVSNLLTGALATRVRVTTLLSIAMAILSAALLSLPYIRNYTALVAYAIVMGIAGGMVTVLFFTVWARLYGRTHLGRIQGIAQLLTVFASALGPVIMAEVRAQLDTYYPAVMSFGAVSAMLAVAAAFVPIPRRKEAIVLLPKMAPSATTP